MSREEIAKIVRIEQDRMKKAEQDFERIEEEVKTLMKGGKK